MNPAIANHSPAIASAPGWPTVLYFHHISEEINHYTSISKEQFRIALKLLTKSFTPLVPQELPLVFSQDRDWSKHCLITFDDGYEDNFSNARSILKEFEWRAVFFIIVDRVGGSADHDVRGRLQYMTWDQLRTLSQSGHIIASHGSAHVKYADLTPEQACADFEQAKNTLKAEFPDGPDWFAYPYGSVPDYSMAWPSLCFGTVRSPPLPWDRAPHEIRRTFLPSDNQDSWPDLIEAWSDA